jgi:hypothetical protein
MLRIQLDINGRVIGEIGVWNRQEYNDDGEVRYSVYDLRGFDGESIEDAPHITDVWHDRSDGATSLTERVMGEVGEEWLEYPHD